MDLKREKIKVRKASAWAKCPMWKKRLHGFASYMIAAFAALIWPVEIDKAAYTALRDQFED